MNGLVNVVLVFSALPDDCGDHGHRAGLLHAPELKAMDKPNFEQILPQVLFHELLPVGVVGFLLAGLMAAFMSRELRRHAERSASLCGERHLQALHQSQFRRQSRGAG